MNIFFDLDGTLTDPFEGITDAVRFALQASGLVAPPAQDLSWVIGPPLIDTFTQLDVPDPQAALAHYRQHYTDQGLFKAQLYDGVLPALETLSRQGHRLFLMTAKPHAYARKITEHFGISPFLEREFGPELDGRFNDKALLLAFALDQLGLVGGTNVMIGDRRYDFVAAAQNDMPSIGALWGYGTAEEHKLATHLCEEPAKIPSIVTGLA